MALTLDRLWVLLSKQFSDAFGMVCEGALYVAASLDEVFGGFENQSGEAVNG